MVVTDLKEGMKVTLLSTYKKAKHEEKKTIRKIDKNYIYIDAIFINKMVVNLGKANNYLIVDLKGQEPQIFQFIQPNVCKKDGKVYYRIDLKKKESVKYNRRHNFRCFIGEQVFVRADSNATTHPCILKDLSAVGFALVFREKDLPKDYESVKTFHFIFNDFEPEYGFSVVLNLTGVVKRMEKLDDNKYLFGCEIARTSKVEKYVADKERLKQKAKNKGMRRVH